MRCDAAESAVARFGSFACRGSAPRSDAVMRLSVLKAMPVHEERRGDHVAIASLVWAASA